ncbi:MAG: hypothetical protein IT224_08315 [Flavobacteriales bacterium]|nr:hypothetical protein [Flavobacteriales bacterium]
MRTLRPLSIAFLSLIVHGATAQDEVRIADIAQMVRKPDLAQENSVRSGLQAAGVEDDRVQQVLSMGKASNLPLGLRTDSALAANAASVKNYNAHKVCTYADEAGTKVLVQVPVNENYHMPEDLRTSQDLYLILPESAVEMTLTDAQRPKPSKGPDWKRMRQAKILTPDAVYATYDLGNDSTVLSKLAGNGLSQPEIDAMVVRSHERNWPAGIDSFERRYPKLKEFKHYKAFEAAHWEDKVLLVIPTELNKRQPIGLRPHLDIYMVYAKSAVEVKKKRKK